MPARNRNKLCVLTMPARVHRGRSALHNRAWESAKADFVLFQRRVSNPSDFQPSEPLPSPNRR